MSSPERSLTDRTDSNRSAARLLALPNAAVAALVIGILVGVLITWWLGVLAALVVGAAILIVLPRSVAPGLTTVFGAERASEDEFARYHNLVEGLTMSSGITAPELCVIDDPGLNIAAYGAPEEAVIVATTGLLNSLERIELEGVLAAALQRIRSYDAFLGGQAAVLVCGPLVKAGPSRGDVVSGPLVFAPQRARRLKKLLGPQREFLSDLAAVDMTRYPPGLGAALEKIEAGGSSVTSATWGSAHLWLADPLTSSSDAGADALNKLFANDTPIEQRAMLMAEL